MNEMRWSTQLLLRAMQEAGELRLPSTTTVFGDSAFQNPSPLLRNRTGPLNFSVKQLWHLKRNGLLDCHIDKNGDYIWRASLIDATTRYAIVRDFVAEVNRRAEADMLAGNPVTGAHHRAMQAVLSEQAAGGDREHS